MSDVLNYLEALERYDPDAYGRLLAAIKQARFLRPAVNKEGEKVGCVALQELDAPSPTRPNPLKIWSE